MAAHHAKAKAIPRTGSIKTISTTNHSGQSRISQKQGAGGAATSGFGPKIYYLARYSPETT